MLGHAIHVYVLLSPILFTLTDMLAEQSLGVPAHVLVDFSKPHKSWVRILSIFILSWGVGGGGGGGGKYSSESIMKEQ